jgi:hypothetical protein
MGDGQGEDLMSVVDFHIHVLPFPRIHPWVRDWMQQFVEEPLEPYLDRICTPQGTLAMMDEAGVDYGVVLAEYSPITAGMLVTNEEVAEFCQGQERLIPFANINPYLTPDPAGELRRCVERLGMRGVKILPPYHHFYPTDKFLYPLYAVAQEAGIPAFFHTGSSVFRSSKIKYGDPLFLEEVALDFPNLIIIMAHSGRGFWMDRAAYLARLHENVYLELAGLPPQNLLSYFPDLEELADKTIFGSDWPAQPFMKQNVRAIRQLPISTGAKAKILGENAARLLGLSRG